MPEANVANKSKSENIRVIAGAAVGAIVVIIIIIVIIVIACRRRKIEKDKTTTDNNETEFEIIDSSLSVLINDFKTSYVTQEMMTSLIKKSRINSFLCKYHITLVILIQLYNIFSIDIYSNLHN